MHRRIFLQTAAAGLALPVVHSLGQDAVNPFQSFDDEVAKFMKPRNIPGASLAVAKNGKLVYARGYGLGDVEKNERVTPQSVFRIASISKPITGVAVLKLVQEGKVELNDLAIEWLERFFKETLSPVDKRWKQITIRQLLQHTGGWDRDASFDPMFRSVAIARELRVQQPADAVAVIRYMLKKPLQFDPGQKYAYSNFGYCILGRIIEIASGRSYEKFVMDNVLQPLGIKRTRLGQTRIQGRAEDEVRYYMAGNDKGRSVFELNQRMVPWPYGAFNLEAMDAHGGWISSAVDLVRFASALEPVTDNKLLPKELSQELYAPPAAPVSRDKNGKLKDYYYGCGWLVRPVGRGRANYWHGGSLPGTRTLLVRRHDGLCWAILFNMRDGKKGLPDGAIDPALHRAANAVKDWPDVDLFGKYL